MNVPRCPAAVHGPVGLLAAAAFVFASGCAGNGTNSGFPPLSARPTPVAAQAPRKIRPASLSMRPAAVALPHGSDCVCPTIVTGTSHGCWEALD